MGGPVKGTITDLDRRILDALRADARMSFRALGKRLGVSTPTVAKRVRRLESSGVIQGYTILTPRLPPPDALPSRLTCVHCRQPVEGRPRLRRMGERTVVFCCNFCAEAYTERRRPTRTSRGAASSSTSSGPS